MINLKNYYIYPCRSDLIHEQKKLEEITYTNTKIKKYKDNNYDYITIFFNNLNNKNNIKKIIIKELLYFLNKLNIKKDSHI